MNEKPTMTTEEFSSFDDQWDKPNQITVGEETFDVKDIRPENLKSEVPVIVGPGWSETPEAFKANIRRLVESGRRVIAHEAPHGIEAESKEGHPDIELRKVTALIETLNALGVEKADVIAHSEGAIFSVLAAFLYPEKFRNLILVNPAGMIGQDSLPRLVVGFTSDMIKERVNGMKKDKNADKKPPQDAEASTLSLLAVLGRNPIQAVKSVLAIADSDIRDMLENIRSKGIHVSVVATIDDIAFPMGKMQSAIDTKHVDGFYSAEGTHNSPRLGNNEPYSGLMVHALDNMEELSEKENANQ